MIYAIDIYKNRRELNMIIGITAIIIGIFEAFIIFIYYIFFNIIYCIFHDDERTIGEFEMYDGGKYKKFADFFNYMFLTLEWVINVPIIIILLFYMYNNNVLRGDLYISWY